MCSKRKVKVKINVKDYVSVMESLGVIPKEESEVREFIIDVDDSKETYEYLLASEAVMDWETVSSPESYIQKITWPDTPLITNPWTTSPGWQPGEVYCSTAECNNNVGKIKEVNLGSGATNFTTTSKKYPTFPTSSNREEEISSIADTIDKAYGHTLPGKTKINLLQAIYEVKSVSPAFRFSKRAMETEILPRVQLQEPLPDEAVWAEKAETAELPGILAAIQAHWNEKESDVYVFLNNIFTR